MEAEQLNKYAALPEELFRVVHPYKKLINLLQTRKFCLKKCYVMSYFEGFYSRWLDW